MRDCEHCKRALDGTCAMLECQGFVYRPTPTPEDKEIYENAAQRVDTDRHPENKHGSRRVAKAEERIEQAKSQRKPVKPQLQSKPQPQHKTPFVECGMRLYFKNRFTGHIQAGVGMSKGWRHFVFRYDNKSVKLPYKCVGQRLFTTQSEAQEKGKFTGP